jgi:hypothetical protein
MSKSKIDFEVWVMNNLYELNNMFKYIKRVSRNNCRIVFPITHSTTRSDATFFRNFAKYCYDHSYNSFKSRVSNLQ